MNYLLTNRSLWVLVVIVLVTLTRSTTWAGCSGQFTMNEGILGGNGRINGDLTNFGGTLSPGDGIGSFTVTGSYCQLPAAGMLLEIGGLQQRIEHDLLTINGTAELSGEFRIDLVNDFSPSVGDEFELLNLRQVEGGFDTFTAPDLGANTAWDFSTLLDDGVARVVPEPAFRVWLLGLAFAALRTKK